MYWVAPMSGSFVATILYKHVFGRDFSSLKESLKEEKHETSTTVVTNGNDEVEDGKF
jgi:hypothetical protein